MHAQDGESEVYTDGLQRFAFSTRFTNQVVSLLVGTCSLARGLYEYDIPQ